MLVWLNAGQRRCFLGGYHWCLYCVSKLTFWWSWCIITPAIFMGFCCSLFGHCRLVIFSPQRHVVSCESEQFSKSHQLLPSFIHPSQTPIDFGGIFSTRRHLASRTTTRESRTLSLLWPWKLVGYLLPSCRPFALAALVPLFSVPKFIPPWNPFRTWRLAQPFGRASTLITATAAVMRTSWSLRALPSNCWMNPKNPQFPYPMQMVLLPTFRLAPRLSRFYKKHSLLVCKVRVLCTDRTEQWHGRTGGRQACIVPMTHRHYHFYIAGMQEVPFEKGCKWERTLRRVFFVTACMYVSSHHAMRLICTGWEMAWVDEQREGQLICAFNLPMPVCKSEEQFSLVRRGMFLTWSSSFAIHKDSTRLCKRHEWWHLL